MKRTLWIIILISALGSVGILGQRFQVERANTAVEIVYDLPSLVELSTVTGVSLEDLLLELKQAGVETIAVQPQNLAEWLLERKPLPEEIETELPAQSEDLGKFLLYPIAFRPEDLEAVHAAGLGVAPKLNTSPWKVEPLWLPFDPDLLIVSGQRELFLDKLPASAARVALVEFSTPQIQPPEVERMVRLHGISAPEMLVLSEERILNRYVRAVRERNIRVLYLRAFVQGERPRQRTLELLSSLQSRLGAAGFALGKAQPFAGWHPPRYLLLLASLGIWSAALLYGIGLFPKQSKVGTAGAIAAFLGTAVLLFLRSPWGAQGLALVAAIVFPGLALQTEWGSSAAKSYWLTALVSVLGALFVASLLSGTEYLLKLREFRGVKLMHIVPVALVVFTLLRPLRPWLDRSLPVRLLLGLGLVGLVGVVYILRTGNFGLSVPRLEVAIRERLENLLRTRPRTKEFLVGHPALYVALHQKEPRRSWWLPVAVIGQISLVNSFTHIHTPLWVSILRTFYGLLFGYALGWLGSSIYRRGKRWLQGDRNFGLLRF